MTHWSRLLLMDTTKCGLYLRSSVDKTGEELGVTRQREDLLKLVRARGWQPVEYVENNVSATSRKPRPEYQRMLSDLTDGTVQALAVWDLDRLYRRPRELEDLIDLAEIRPIPTITIGGDLDLNTDNGRTYARVKVAFARAEIERKSARQKRANIQKAEMGKPHGGGTRAFGYRKNFTDDKKYLGDTIVEEEAQQIRKAYSALLAGASLYSIAAQWNSDGITSTRGNRWSGETVRQVLINPRYAAIRYHLGTEVTTAQWEPIVSRDIWEAAAAILSDPKRNTGRSPGRKRLLTGIARCGECKQPIGSGKGTTGKPTYVCKHCFKVTRQSEKTDAVIIDAVAAVLARPDAAQVFAKPSADTKALRAQAEALQAQIQAAKDEYDEGIIDGARLAGRTKKVGEKLAKVEAELLSANTSRVLDGLLGREDARQRLLSLPLDRQRAVIATVGTPWIARSKRGARFDPRLVTIEWHTPE